MADPLYALQPQSAGDILDRAARLYRRHFFFIVRLALIPLLLTVPLDLWADAFSESWSDTHGFLRTAPTWALLLIASQWLSSLVEAALARWISGVNIGPSHSPWILYASPLRRSLALGCNTLLEFPLGFGGVLMTVGGVWGAIAILLESGHIERSILLTLAVVEPIGVGLLIVASRLLLTVAVIAVEEVPWLAALKRSWRLVRGGSWRAVAVMLFSLVLGLGPRLMFLYAGGLLDLPIPEPVGELLVEVTSSLLSPIGYMAMALLYFDCRIRREGLDLEMLVRRLDGVETPASPGVPA